ncbi:MAG: class I SAM-dependent DNA methyltransferase [Candidatus Hydrogenedentes bacterium]|nr:class I SAM-dependent DNA methyltransferase [Candidatus Hydrogenedentota bacterium]
MSISWNEIRQRAIRFSREWEGSLRERADAQTFWNEFFDVFGIRRRTVASFEEPVKTLKGTYGFIDLFWKGRLLAEHKSAGKPLDKAQVQAFDYIQSLQRDGRDDEVPRYIIVSDFSRIVLYDLEPEDQGELFKGQGLAFVEVPLAELHKHVRHFAFIIGQRTHRFREEDPANIEAAGIMAELHDAVEAGGYTGDQLEQLLVRILFCLFADDTGIFEGPIFQNLIEYRTRGDGSDLGARLFELFDVLNTPVEARNEYMDEDLSVFPYVNGDLFAQPLRLAGFNRDMRNRLLAACRFNWERISPAVFGSLFQGIMDDKERRQIGAHYTSERDILKLIKPLFLDGLWAEFEQIKKDRSVRRQKRLLEFQQKLARINCLDPACGCGNFLVIAYRELRRLELEVLKERHVKGKQKHEEFDYGEVAKMSLVDVNQFYGIEIGEWPARIAETALWLTDHQMNIELSETFGNIFQRIPLRAAPHIACKNALRMDWNDLLPADQCSYVFGNPPFVGKAFQSAEQKEDLKLVSDEVNGNGNLDYVTGWYWKASNYMKCREIEAAFVSTNSVTQGEQVPIIWHDLFQKGLHINFAHRTFAWQSEARGAAHVHVVIIGFGFKPREQRVIFEYDDIKGEPQARYVQKINPYLVEGAETFLPKRTHPLCDVSEMIYGSKPVDGGYLILDPQAREELLKEVPEARGFIRPFLGSEEFINGLERWCLWLHETPPDKYRHIKPIMRRIEQVREFRLQSKKARTRADASRPYAFSEIRQPSSDYILVPEVSSERRLYIPIGFVKANVICSNLAYMIPEASGYEFGILTSSMHMAWVRHVCGRLESRYRYSAKLVYNNYPWPQDVTTQQRNNVKTCAKAVLNARQKYLDAGQTLADLYDPLTMPGGLLNAHQALDRAVDRCYRAKKFENERERVEFLFGLYEQFTSPLAPTDPIRRKRQN